METQTEIFAGAAFQAVKEQLKLSGQHVRGWKLNWYGLP